MASKARPWLGKGTHSVIVLFLRRMGSLSLAMRSFASHCEAGNDAVVVYQPTMIPGTRGRSGMDYFLQQLVNGISLGAIYALIAIGYTMVYGIIGMINFAH